MTLADMEEARDADCVVIAVAHDRFRELPWQQLAGMYRQGMPAQERVLIDVKGIRDRREAQEAGYRYWRL